MPTPLAHNFNLETTRLLEIVSDDVFRLARALKDQVFPYGLVSHTIVRQEVIHRYSLRATVP